MNYCPACDQSYAPSLLICPEHQIKLHPVAGLDETAELMGDPLIGTVLSQQYEIRRLLGRGGMGSVYAAYQLSTSREVAIKMINADAPSEGLFEKRFLREAFLMSQLKSPNTVTVFDFGRTETGRLFIAMELLEGMSLEALANKDKSLDVRRCLKLLTQACSSLTEAHQRGIIHRDIKPDNLFVMNEGSKDEFLKVLDFGIARSLDTSDQTRLTKTGFINGTPHYMAPEVALGREPTAAADVYALGVVLFELLTGEPPFNGKSLTEVLMAHCNKPIPHFDADPPSVLGPLFQSLVNDALQKNVRDRISSIEEFRDRLDELLTKDLSGLSFRSSTSTTKGPPATDAEAELGLPSLESLVNTDSDLERDPAKPNQAIKQSVLKSTLQNDQIVPSENVVLAHSRFLSRGRIAILVVVGVALWVAGAKVSILINTPSVAEKALELSQKQYYPAALKLINDHIATGEMEEGIEEVLTSILKNHTEYLIGEDRLEEAVEFLSIQERTTPHTPFILTELPTLEARLKVRQAIKKHGSRSSDISTMLNKELFSRHKNNAKAYFEVGKLMRDRFIPSVSLGYFKKALELGSYNENPEIFKSIAKQLSDELPFDGSGRAEFARNLAKEYFPTATRAWAKTGKASQDLRTVLNAHALFPSHTSHRWQNVDLDLFLDICNPNVSLQKINSLKTRLTKSPETATAATQFLKALKKQNELGNYGNPQKAALEDLIKRFADKD